MTRQYRRYREFHVAGCPCSMCHKLADSGAYSFGFLAPIDKSWNAWRWLFLVTTRGTYYVRWAGFWKRKPWYPPSASQSQEGS